MENCRRKFLDSQSVHDRDPDWRESSDDDECLEVMPKKKQKRMSMATNGTSSVPCPVPGCLAEYSKYWALDKHLVSGHTPRGKQMAKRLECPKCSKLMLSFGTLYQHCSRQHPNENNLAYQARLVTPPESDEEDEDADLKTVLYNIYDNEKKTTNEGGLHEKDKHCLVHPCSEAFSTYQALDKHLISKHTLEERKTAKKLECLKCGKLFISYQSLFLHALQTHAGSPGQEVARVVIGGNPEDLYEEEVNVLERIELPYFGEKPCLVPTCSEKFGFWADMGKHMLLRHTRLERKTGWSLECPECGKLYQSYNGLSGHGAKVHGRRSADAKYVMQSKKKTEVAQPSRKHSRIKKKCLVHRCSKVLTSWSELDRQLDAKHGMEEREHGEKLKCLTCEHLFLSYKTLCNHSLTEHKSEARRPGGCGKTFPTNVGDSNKVGAWHSSKPFVCPFCNKFRGKRDKQSLIDLCLHLDTCRKESYLEKDPETFSLLKCSSCKEFQCSAKDPSVFANHWMGCRLPSRQLTLGDRIFSCGVCRSDKVWQGRRFFNLKDFLNHFRNHQRLRYECVECGKMLQNTDEAYRHWKNKHGSLTAAGEWKFEVERCAPKLEPHLVPEMPWWCPECDIQFSSEHVRDDHVRAEHLEWKAVKEHQCSFCEKSYACDTELNIHQETTHVVEMGKLVACNLCEDQYFSERKQVLKHLSDFHKDQMLKCFQCPMEFGNVEQLTEHLVAEHQSTGAEQWVDPPVQCATCGKCANVEWP